MIDDGTQIVLRTTLAVKVKEVMAGTASTLVLYVAGSSLASSSRRGPRIILSLLTMFLAILSIYVLHEIYWQWRRVVLKISDVGISLNGRPHKKNIRWDSLRNVYLTKAMGYRSWGYAVVLEGTNFNRIFINDDYDIKSAELFCKLKEFASGHTIHVPFFLKILLVSDT